MSQVSNFYPINDPFAFYQLHKQLEALGMSEADGIRMFAVDEVDNAGTYRMEPDTLHNRHGFYIFKDRKSLDMVIEGKGAVESAEDVMRELVSMFKLNRGLHEYERVTTPLAEISDAHGNVRLYDSGVVVLSTKDTENMISAHMATEGGPVPQEVLNDLSRLLEFRFSV